MRTWTLIHVFSAIFLPLALACEDTVNSDPVETDVIQTDTLADSNVVADLPIDNSTGTDTQTDDALVEDIQGDSTGEDSGADATLEDTVADSQTDDTTVGPYGFTIRVPLLHELEYEQFPGAGVGTIELWDIDHVCTFEYGDTHGLIYVQAGPIGYDFSPTYEAVAGWTSIDGDVQPLEDVEYSYGYNHHNDWISFSWQTETLKFYHSSFGYGWRKCQPMDCIQVFVGENVIDDGCTKERTLPVVCVDVDHDGNVADLVDMFEPCPGDTNYQEE